MTRAGLLVALLGFAVWACDGNTTGPAPLEGTYTLVAENDQPLPSDPSAPDGCCLTLSGSLVLAGGTYQLRTSHRTRTTASASTTPSRALTPGRRPR